MDYKFILSMKEASDKTIRLEYGEEAVRLLNYYKGNLLPFINTNVRKDMTCGDLDSFQVDYKKKIFRFIENKLPGERHKVSQDIVLNILAKIMRMEGFTVEVYKVIGAPPYDFVTIIDVKTNERKHFQNDEFISFLNMEIDFHKNKYKEN